MRTFWSLFGTRLHRAALGAAVAVVLVATAAPAFDVMPAWAASAPTAVAGPQPSLIEFDVKGAVNAFSNTCFNAFLGVVGCGTTPLANNDLGEVVGTYTDASFVQHAFLRAPNGYITTIDAPGAGAEPGQGTVAFAINDVGVIAGAFADSNNVFHGFLRFPNGSFQHLDAPGAGTGPGRARSLSTSTCPGLPPASTSTPARRTTVLCAPSATGSRRSTRPRPPTPTRVRRPV